MRWVATVQSGCGWAPPAPLHCFVPAHEIHQAVTDTPASYVKFIWNEDMPYKGVEWELAFPMRAFCLHRERYSALQIPVVGLPVPDEFHGEVESKV